MFYLRNNEHTYLSIFILTQSLHTYLFISILTYSYLYLLIHLYSQYMMFKYLLIHYSSEASDITKMKIYTRTVIST